MNILQNGIGLVTLTESNTIKVEDCKKGYHIESACHINILEDMKGGDYGYYIVCEEGYIP